MQNNILVVDDEKHILELIKYNLENSGYNVIESKSGEEALKIVDSCDNIDCMVLDWTLSGIDGMAVLRTIRLNPKSKYMPIIMLTAKNANFDTAFDLEMGADEYIKKPFSIRELIIKLKSLLRRSENLKSIMSEHSFKKICIDNIIINQTFKTVYKNNTPVEISLKEYELLLLLAQNSGKVFSREDLVKKIWGYDFLGEIRIVDVHIRNIRKKIENDHSNPQLIKTVRGIGYRFKEGARQLD